MKKLLLFILLALAPLCCAAESARDITAESALSVVGREGAEKVIRDGDWETGVRIRGDVEQIILVTPGETPVAAVCVQFGPETSGMAVETWDGAAWRVAASTPNSDQAECSLHFEPLSQPFRLRFTGSRPQQPAFVRELRLFSAGEIDPERCRDWLPPCEKADILFVVAHPDDELLWFGGAIPSCADAGRDAQVVYLTCETIQRRQELLAGLWHCGVRHYPQINGWTDGRAKRETVLRRWNGEQAVLDSFVRMLRRFCPEVVVTHGTDGESGHIQHRLCAEFVQRALPLAADPAYLPEAGPAWQVKKLYLHGGDQPTLRMDWDLPLQSFGGRSGLTLAREGFACHRSQNHKRYHVQAPGEENDSTLFTLVLTQVGEDQYGNDFFEHLEPQSAN